MDRDGIPWYSTRKHIPIDAGVQAQRVFFTQPRRGSSSHNLEGSGADEEKKSLEKKRSRFARKLLDALHREAFRTAERFKKTEKIREYPAD